MTVKVTDSLKLPSGSVLKNRLAKSAMSETLGTYDNHPTQALATLYRRWARGGTGLLITGNVMVDRRALGEPKNVVIEDDQDLFKLQQWAQAGQETGAQHWVQLNHPGKQSPNILSPQPVAPSAIPFKPPLNRMFNTPVALTNEQILDIIRRFGTAAEVVKKAGFDGVQIHGAHGYLVSQFLSPLHNQRTDQWGGSLQNRMRFACEVYRSIRAAVGEGFNVGIKLNSADFQRGGFSEDESIQVAKTLGDLGMDLIEISGGTYASPNMTGVRHDPSKAASTLAREAYFIDYAAKIREQVKAPLMITGGFRTSAGIAEALASGALDVAGLARPLAVDPEFSHKVLTSERAVSSVKPIKTGIKLVDKMAMMEIAWYTQQIGRLAKGKDALESEGTLSAVTKVFSTMAYRGLRNRTFRA